MICDPRYFSLAFKSGRKEIGMYYTNRKALAIASSEFRKISRKRRKIVYRLIAVIYNLIFRDYAIGAPFLVGVLMTVMTNFVICYDLGSETAGMLVISAGFSLLLCTVETVRCIIELPSVIKEPETEEEE